MSFKKLFVLLFLSTFCFYSFASEEVCEYPTTETRPDESGKVTVKNGVGDDHQLYWVKLKAKIQPAQGTLFYLAGGPLSHVLYTDLAATFQRTSFPHFDVILYDYFGFNCSTPIQTLGDLEKYHRGLTVAAMAQDFAQLKQKLMGDEKVFIMGGSHGAFLGAQILSDYPGIIEKAILFAGDTQSDWFVEGWFRFDEVLVQLDREHPGFQNNLTQLLEKAEMGELQFEIEGQRVSMKRDLLEMALWLSFSQSSIQQNLLPAKVEQALSGNMKWLEDAYLIALILANPISSTPTPTDVSQVTNFHRCNIWYPKSRRAHYRPGWEGSFLSYSSFQDYWDRFCKRYDYLGEFPFQSTPKFPSHVPLLYWTGDRDFFDPVATRNRWGEITTSLQFHLMQGWSHDFGPRPQEGFVKVIGLIKNFLAL